MANTYINHDHELLTIEEVSRILRIDDTTCRRYIKQGTLDAVILPHVGKRQGYRIPRAELNRILGIEQQAS